MPFRLARWPFIGCLALLCLAALMPLTPAYAASTDTRVALAERWLNALTTAQARFVQTAPDGRTASGTFYLQRPGRLRFSYDPPNRDYVLADGLFLYFYDSVQKQTSSALIGSTLADFLLRPQIKLGGDLLVKNVRVRDGALMFTLTQKADPGAGQLILYFDEGSQTLTGWDVIDPQGLTTRIALSDMRTGHRIPAGLFVMPQATQKNHLRR